MKSWKGSVPTSQKKRLNKYFFHFVGAQTLSRWVTNSLFHAGFLPTFVSEGRKKPLYCSMFSGAPAAAVYGNSCLLANRPVFILCHASCQQRHLKNNFHAQRKGSAPPLPAAHFLSPVFQMLIWRSFWWWIVGWDEPAVPAAPTSLTLDVCSAHSGLLISSAALSFSSKHGTDTDIFRLKISDVSCYHLLIV